MNQRILLLLGATCMAAPACAQDMRLNGYWASPPPTIAHETIVHPGEPDDLPPNPEPPRRLVTLLQPWAKAIHLEYVDLIKARRAVSLEAPTLDNMCLPVAIPSEGSAAYGFPLQILATPRVVIFLMELDHQNRIIRINGTHPAKPIPSWYGDSVGHWESNTLVVDTVGFNDRTEIQEWPGGFPHTAQMHTIERYTVSADGSKLTADWTYEDPGALTSPFKSGNTLMRGEPYQEFVNAEHNVEFPCPTAEHGTSYKKLSIQNLDAQLADTRAVAAQAKPPAAQK